MTLPRGEGFGTRNDPFPIEIYAVLNRYILRIILVDYAMKRSLSIALCLFLLLSYAIPALAASGGYRGPGNWMPVFSIKWKEKRRFFRARAYFFICIS